MLVPFMTDLYSKQYLFVVVFLAVAVGFPLAPLVLARILAPRKAGQTKNDIYECGLTSKGDAWVSSASAIISMHWFM